jgi:hypothetical protein
MNPTMQNLRPWAAMFASAAIFLLSARPAQCQANCAPVLADCIGWWRGETNGFDELGLNEASLHGGASFALGVSGRAFALDGVNDYLCLNRVFSQQLSNVITVEAWVYPTTWGARQRIMTKHLSYSLWLDAEGRPGFVLHLVGVGEFLLTGPFAIPTNSWTHIAATYDRTQMRLYINGVLQAELAATQPMATAAIGEATLGAIQLYSVACGYGDLAEFYAGLIDELAVYRRALSAAEILAIYNSGAVGKCRVAPVVTQQPTNQVVLQSESASFQVQARGSLPFTYQWFFGANALAGATNATLALTGLLPVHSGDYRVLVSGPGGSATSDTATLTVVPVELTNRLLNVNFTCLPATNGSKTGFAALGQTVSDFWNHASGTAPGLLFADGGASGAGLAATGVTNCSSLPGPDPMLASTLTGGTNVLAVVLTNLSPGRYDLCAYSEDGRFQLTVGSRNYGSLASRNVPLAQPPAWVTGRQYVRFQDVRVLDATEPLTLLVQPGAGGVSAIAGLQLANVPPGNRTAPVIVQQTTPVTATLAEGIPVQFTALASGSERLFYQWFHGTSPIPGATNWCLYFPHAELGDAGSYFLRASNDVGYADSLPASLTMSAGACVNAPTGMISWWRAEGVGWDDYGGADGQLVGTNAGFAPGLVGEALTFPSAAGNPAMVVPDAPELNFGSHVDFTIEAWIKTSSSGNLLPILEKTINPSGSQMLGYGFAIDNGWLELWLGTQPAGDVSFFTAAGPDLRDGRWHHVAASVARNITNGGMLVVDGDVVLMFDASARSGDLTSYVPLNIGRTTPPYVVSFEGQLDEVTLYKHALSLAELQTIQAARGGGKCLAPNAPVITEQPRGADRMAGQQATLNVAAVGRGPMRYFWQRSGTNLPGATARQMVIAPASVADAGSYRVLVTNSYGTATSEVAVLTVTSVPPCAPVPSDLVMWLRAENDARDSVGTNHIRILSAGASYQTGLVGQGIAFDGISGSARVTPLRNFPQGAADRTVELWVLVDQFTSGEASFFSCGFPFGVGAFELKTSGQRFAFWQGSVTLLGPPVPLGRWVHLAVANIGTNVSLYVDGELAAATNALLNTGSNFGLNMGVGFQGGFFRGKIDEVSFYSRTLSAAEIRAIYEAGSAGKCLTPPAIVSHPVSQTVIVGDRVDFSVAASGTVPFNFQWLRNGFNLADATNSGMSIPIAQESDSGAYSVRVSSDAGSAVSSNALLTVLPTPPCATLPPGIVAWWRGETNATDALGRMNGVPVDGGELQFSYSTGKAGSAFSTGGGTYVRVPPSPPLDVGAGSGLTVELWIRPDRVYEGRPLVEWHQPDAARNAYFWICLGAPGSLDANLVAEDGSRRELGTPGGVVLQGLWQHVALTYDRDSGNARIYHNGMVVAHAALGSFRVRTTGDLVFGYSPAVGLGEFFGVLDEIGLYDRALDESEIAAIYAARGGGKCVPPPSPVLRGATPGQGICILRFQGADDRAYEVQRSTNLVEWVPLGPAAHLGSGRFEFMDPELHIGGARFYRLLDSGPSSP